MGEPRGTVAGLGAIGIEQIVLGLVSDLQDLREGRITIPMARARTQAAHEILRGINLVITGQRMIEARALKLPSLDDAKAKRRAKGIAP